MDGLECTRLVRTRQPPNVRSPFIIAHSADTTPDAQQQCRLAGCNTFLPKPVQLDSLVRILHDAYAVQHPQTKMSPVEKAAAAAHPHKTSDFEPSA
jgi:CheY-like chemotaxis protein